MKLLSIPNIPNYQVDVENGVVYTMKYGRLKIFGNLLMAMT
jgi:hypothetical protein